VPFDLAKINIWAVLVAALIAFFIGGLWYTALFGKLWIRLHGYSEEKVKQMQAAMSPPLFFGGMLLSYLVLSFALAVLLTGFTDPNVLTGLALGLVFWIGAAAVAMTGQIASDRSNGIYLIDIGCNLVYLLLMGALLGFWR
jgi:Protein of unknown function (DUF1761)